MKKYILAGAVALRGGHLLVEGDEVYAELGLEGQIYNIYDPKKRRQIGYTTKEKFEAVIGENEPEKDFTNGFISWLETYTEIILYIVEALASKSTKSDYKSEVFEALDSEGYLGARQLATKWADEFEKANQGREWDGEFYEEVEAFVKHKDLGISLDEARTKVQRNVTTVSDILLNSIDNDGEQFDITDDQKKILADENLIMFNLELGWHYFPENYDSIIKILNNGFPEPKKKVTKEFVGYVNLYVGDDGSQFSSKIYSEQEKAAEGAGEDAVAKGVEITGTFEIEI